MVLSGLLLALSVLVRLPITLDFDTRVTKGLQVLDRPALGKAAAWSTFMGNSPTLTAAAIIGAVWFLLSGNRTAALALPFALLALPLNMAIKKVVSRARPMQEVVRVELHLPRWGFSFPSGHAMASGALYWFMAFLVIVSGAQPYVRIPLVTLLTALPVAIGLSRVYVGAHWFSDVVAGWAGGLLIVVVFGALYPV